LRSLIEDHRHYTGSEIADRVLRNFHRFLPMFVRVMPLDYKRVLIEQEERALEEKKRQSVIDLIPSQTASQVDLVATGFDPILPGNADTLSVPNSQLVTPTGSPKNKPTEPTIVDVEDAMIDEQTTKDRMVKLDKTRGFMKYKRLNEAYRPPRKRVKDWKEISSRLTNTELKYQSARCMDCGIPFCQSDTGCPIANVIPKWNTMVFEDRWLDALNRLLKTNNFPEFTGRVCPAPCESACVLGINEAPVGIKSIECAIIDKGFEMGWMQPQPPTQRTGKRVAIIGSGPAGLAAADQLNKAGHSVTVYERNDRVGGLLMYGIPNMKLDKKIVQRRVDLMAAEGINFITNAHVGVNTDAVQIKEDNDAVIVATGATWPRDLKLPNREVDGIHFAMDFLQPNTKSLLDSELEDGNYISAKGKDVIVIGGGDTGNDCIGTSARHGAASVVNFELLPEPPNSRASNNPWPQFARVKKNDYGHSEISSMNGGKDPREYCISTKRFVLDDEGKLKGLDTVRVDWQMVSGQWKMEEIRGSEKFYPAQLVLLALGFLGPQKEVVNALGIKQDPRTNIVTPPGKYSTNIPKVFSVGDARRGQSLVVWGIKEGRQGAEEVDNFLTGNSRLAYQGGIPRRAWIAPPVATAAESAAEKKLDMAEQDPAPISVGA